MESLSEQDIQRIISGLTRNLKADVLDSLQADDSFLDAVRGPAGPPGVTSSLSGGTNIKAREIGYYWPDCPVTESQPEGPTVIASNGDVIYRSHARFFARLDDVVATFEYDKVKMQLVQCLRGLAQDWYANELDELDRQGIRDDSSNTFRVFKARCSTRFAKTSLKANRLLMDTKFGIQDIRSGVRIASYAHKKMLYAEEAGYVSSDDPGCAKKKLDFIYNDLDPALRMYVEAPTSRDTVRDYMARLAAKENSWIDYYSSRGNRQNRVIPVASEPYDRKLLPTGTLTDKTRFVKQISGTGGGGQRAPPTKPCPAHLRERGEAKYHWLQQCDLPSVIAGRKQFTPKQEPMVKAYLGENPISVSEMCSPDFLHSYYGMGRSFNPLELFEPDDMHPDAFHVDGMSNYQYGDDANRFEQMDSDSGSNANSSACVRSYHSDNPLNNLSVCNKCSKNFPSQNKLHAHVQSCHGKAEPSCGAELSVPTEFVLSKAAPSDGRGICFRSFKYMEINIWNPSLTMLTSICLDTGCGMSAIDGEFLKRFAPELKIGLSPEPITVRGIGGTPHISREYVTFSLKIPSVDGRCAVLAPREFHLVSHLGCGVLVGTDILKPERFIMDLGKCNVLLPHCDNLLVACRVSPLSRPKEKRVVTTLKTDVVPAFSVKLIEVNVGRGKKAKAADKTYDFSFGLQPSSAHLSLYGVIPNCLLSSEKSAVAFVNFSDRSVRIDKGLRIGEASKVTEVSGNYVEMEGLKGFFGNLPWWQADEFDIKDLDTSSAKVRFPSSTSPDLMTNIGEESDVKQVRFADDSVRQDKCDKSMFCADAVDINPELPEKDREALRAVLREFPSVWEDRVGQVIEPEEDWLEINLKPGALDALKSKGPYRLSEKDRKVVDEWFDPLVKNGQMTSGVKSPIASPVFVVYRNGKGRAVVDMRGINKWTIGDAYPLPLQDDILQFVANKKYISIFDLVKSFYQRLVKLTDRWKTAVASHRGLEWFNVAPMGCMLSPAHMQRFMDKLLELYREFA